MQSKLLKEMKQLAKSAPKINDQGISDEYIYEALLIRMVEQKFLELFAIGKMNGTVHTCVGQEFSAISVAGQLDHNDWITSNHRCHGHFISKTKNWQGLIDELMGLDSGVCRGIGSSQHLYSSGFLSNGPQCALVPVATGIALHNKMNGNNFISVSYIGEGSLGEGVLYESLNLASLYQLPQLIVCENNMYSQSTPQDLGVSGKILLRPQAFGIKTFEANTWDVANLMIIARQSIDYVRDNCTPAFLLIRTYRLNPHSKGDDNRDPNEIAFFQEVDPLNQLLKIKKWKKKAQEIIDMINTHIDNTADITNLSFDEYINDQLPRNITVKLKPILNSSIRMVQALNIAYRRTLENGAFHLGEDICDPYGGAFKVTAGLSNDFPSHVVGTPISEAGLVGVATGMSLLGTVSYAEIMFGDFITHVFDQLINNVSKMHHMYAFQTSIPVRIRTPMGGKRGYGPTHSQSLEKFLLGIDNIAVVYLSSLIDPGEIIQETQCISCPMVILENKVDYAKFLWQSPPEFEFSSEDKAFGALKITPKLAIPTVTMVAYGETAREIADHLEKIFIETDLVPELIVITMLHPLDISLVANSVKKTSRIIVVEDGAINFGFGAEVISTLVMMNMDLIFTLRIGAGPVPIPSISVLENQILPTIDRIIKDIKKQVTSCHISSNDYKLAEA